MLDLLLNNARVLTLDESRPRAHAVGITRGRIIGVDGDVEHLAARTVVDCREAVVTPGFADAHNHMAWYGLTLSELDLSACRTLADVYSAVARAARPLPADQWVIGYGYDAVAIGGHPDRHALDRAADGRRVWLRHRSGHICAVSSAVLAEAGFLHGHEADPLGGRVVRSGDGSPTGELQEQAQRIVTDLAGSRPIADLSAAVARAARQYVTEGLTHVTEAGIGGGWIGHSPIEAAAYIDAREQGLLPLRVELMVASDVLHPVRSNPRDAARIGLDLGLRSGFGDDWLRIGPMKIFMDGSMTGRTAALSEALCAHGGSRGLLQADADTLRARIEQAHAAGWRIAAHAIGDRALDLALDAIAAAQRNHPRAGVRHRIEHASISRSDQVSRMAQLGVVPVIQGRFIHEVGEAVAHWLGDENVPTLMRHRSFVDAGLHVAGSSDRPVVIGASPLLGIQAMVERAGQAGTILSGHEGVGALEALRAYTIHAAWASHEEDRRGRLTSGMAADLVLLSDDPTAVATSAIGSVKVLATNIGGTWVHGADQVADLAKGPVESALAGVPRCADD